MWNCPIRPFLARIGLSIEPFASHIRLSECFRVVRSQRDSSLLNSPLTIPTRLDVELLAPRFVPSAFRPRSNRFDTKFEAEINILYYIKRLILRYLRRNRFVTFRAYFSLSTTRRLALCFAFRSIRVYLCNYIRV